MLVIGLVGGIASGKSTVAGLLSELGAVVLDADAAAHKVLDTPSTIAELAQTFGDKIVGADGKVDRRQLAGMVFGEHAVNIAVQRSCACVII